MTKRRVTRIYWRRDRAWGDFRDFADVGGKQEALKAEGEPLATEDPDVAGKVAAARVEELEGLRRQSAILGVRGGAPLAKYASSHLSKKRSEGTSPGHLKIVEGNLRVAVDYFGAGRELSSISTREVGAWVRALRKTPNGRGGELTAATAIKYLNALSDLFARAVSDGFAVLNPVRALYRKPIPERVEARYWEPEQVAALLEAARTQPPDQLRAGRGGGGATFAGSYPWIYPLLAAAALTGARKREILGLEVDDISFRYGRIFIRPNDWRDLKTRGSERDVPLWPQLEVILRSYLLKREQAGGLGVLLFPSNRHEEERTLDNVDRALDNIGARAGIEHPRLQAFRHSYTAARLQTLEHGAPVSLWQVSRELGHSSTKQIESRYGHLSRVTDRKEVVEFRLTEAALAPASTNTT